MRGLSIRLRLVLLTCAGLVVLIGSTLYLTRQMAANSRAVVASTALLAEIEQANNARIAFGELRYWLTDLAVSQLTLSETNAAAARERVDQHLAALAAAKPQLVSGLRAELAEFARDANAAVEE